jgi:hypothetical protein
MKTNRKKHIFFTLVLSLLIFGGNVAMAEIYREPNQKLLAGKHFSIVIDRGKLQKAIPSSSGNYLFSEVDAGVKPLVFIGTMQEIIKFLYEKRKIEIRNTIPCLPYIYMSASYYHPKEQFEGIFPVHDAIKEITKFFIMEPVSVPVGTEVATAVTDLAADSKAFQKSLSKIVVRFKKKQCPESPLIYLKISYIKDVGAIEIAKKEVSFESILYELLGVKETRV